MGNKHFDANKKQRDFLSGLGFKYNKVTINDEPLITTFRFDVSEQLKIALKFYNDFNNINR